MQQKVNKKILKSVLAIETMLACIVILSVIIGAVDLAKYIKIILYSKPPNVYTHFQDLLGFVLILVIGLELSLMLIRHTTGSVIEVMLFAIARKILIHSTQIFDILLGVIAIAGIFAIRKFLFISRISEVDGMILSAATSIKDANRLIGTHIPEDLARTLGGVVVNMAKDFKLEIGEGKNFNIADANLEIVNMKDGVIEKIRVETLQDHNKKL